MNSELDKNIEFESDLSMDSQFDKYIEVDPDYVDCDKENTSCRARQPRTTKHQLTQMFSHLKDHNEGLLDKTTSNSLWEKLAAQLNDIGPPAHTTSEWKRIWSEHKKRKQSVLLDADQNATGKCQQLSNKIEGSGIDITPCATSSKRFHCEMDISSKIDVLIDKQTELIEKQTVLIEKQTVLIGQHDMIIKKLDVGNSFMEEIARKSR